MKLYTAFNLLREQNDCEAIYVVVKIAAEIANGVDQNEVRVNL